MELLHVLNASATRLRRIVESLDADQLRERSYAAEWTIADVLSHLGSAAVIQVARIDAARNGEALPDDFSQPIWDAWNAKSPEAKAADSLAADAAQLDQLTGAADGEWTELQISLGPISIDLATLVGFRLNEHTVHTWDIEVTVDAGATLPIDAASLCVDQLSMIVQFTGKPTGTDQVVRIHTVGPSRDLTLTFGEAVALEPSEPVTQPDLQLPAEALVRLVYGRLDPEHTPPVRGTADLDELRRAFPGP